MLQYQNLSVYVPRDEKDDTLKKRGGLYMIHADFTGKSYNDSNIKAIAAKIEQADQRGSVYKKITIDADSAIKNKIKNSLPLACRDKVK